MYLDLLDILLSNLLYFFCSFFKKHQHICLKFKKLISILLYYNKIDNQKIDMLGIH